jgi:hypothetical protein
MTSTEQTHTVPQPADITPNLADFDPRPGDIDPRLAEIRARKTERRAIRAEFAARRRRGLEYRRAQRLHNITVAYQSLAGQREPPSPT